LNSNNNLILFKFGPAAPTEVTSSAPKLLISFTSGPAVPFFIITSFPSLISGCKTKISVASGPCAHPKMVTFEFHSAGVCIHLSTVSAIPSLSASATAAAKVRFTVEAYC